MVVWRENALIKKKCDSCGKVLKKIRKVQNISSFIIIKIQIYMLKVTTLSEKTKKNPLISRCTSFTHKNGNILKINN